MQTFFGALEELKGKLLPIISCALNYEICAIAMLPMAAKSFSLQVVLAKIDNAVL